MAWFDWLTGIFSGSSTTKIPRPIKATEINPATDLHRHEDLHDHGHHGSAGSMFDDWHHHETDSTGHAAGSSLDDWSHGSGIASGHDPFDRW